ncbi:hypothetical protein D3C87_1460520 [compost metagenome]
MAQRGAPPMPAMSETLTAMAFQPSSQAGVVERRKCTPSTSRSVVVRALRPALTSVTAASSPIPTHPRGRAWGPITRAIAAIAASSPAPPTVSSVPMRASPSRALSLCSFTQD